MKLLTILIFIFTLNFLFAQNEIKKITEITNHNDGEFYYPKFSGDDTKIFFTTSNFQGIYYYDLNDRIIKTVTDEIGSGYEYSLSQDNKIIYYRVDNYIDGRKYSSIKSKSLTDLQTEILISDKRDLSTPKVLQNGEVAYNLQNKLEISSSKNIKNVLSQNDVLVFIEDSKIALYENGVKKILAPKGAGNYIWPSVSPNKTKLLFTLAGKGTYVSDLNGNIISELGYANAPQWSQDSKWIIYMVDKDNGEYVTSSDVFIIPVDGKTNIQLTNTSDVFEMYPQINKAGKKFVCNTYDGQILLFELTRDF
ncbi:MAG: hypothetical protein ABI550_03410 [Ignavibacteriaceae bacterium]